MNGWFVFVLKSVNFLRFLSYFPQLGSTWYEAHRFMTFSPTPSNVPYHACRSQPKQTYTFHLLKWSIHYLRNHQWYQFYSSFHWQFGVLMDLMDWFLLMFLKKFNQSLHIKTWLSFQVIDRVRNNMGSVKQQNKSN